MDLSSKSYKRGGVGVVDLPIYPLCSASLLMTLKDQCLCVLMYKDLKLYSAYCLLHMSLLICLIFSLPFHLLTNMKELFTLIL